MPIRYVIIIILAVFTLIMIGLELLRSKYVLNVTRTVIPMEILPKNFDGTKMVVIGDLHQMRFGEYNELLAKKIKIEEPDYIFFVGDMGDSKKYNVDAFYDLLETLGRDIPFIMVPGNHDLRLGGGKVHKNFLREVSSAGAVLLDNACAEMKAGNDKLYIYGYTQPLKPQKGIDARMWQYASVSGDSLTGALGKCPDDAPVIMLAHDPTYFTRYTEWGADLVLSGHMHGGLIRLPFIGGLLSPNLNFFPKYSAGLYKRGKNSLFVTRGLGTGIFFRFCNPPEISVLTLSRPDTIAKQKAAEKARQEAARQNRKAGVRVEKGPESPKESISEWFSSEYSSAKSLLQERSNQISDFFSELFGKKKSRFAKEADRRKQRNTYTAQKAAKRMSSPKSEEPHDPSREKNPYIYTKPKQQSGKSQSSKPQNGGKKRK